MRRISASTEQLLSIKRAIVLVNRFDFIAVEDLAVNHMVHNHCLAKSIADAAWSQFTTFVAYKAAYAGRTVS